MMDGRTAQDRLHRLLHVLPAASRPGGARLTELAAGLDVSESRILEDLEEVTARNFYHPGGWLDDVQILVGPDHVEVSRADGFERPTRLTPEETLCLALALRGGPASAHLDAPVARERLLRRAEGYLAHQEWSGDAAPSIEAPDRDPDPEGIREILVTGARDQRPCAISYVKAGASEESVRVVHPYAIAYGEGAWYAVAHCTLEEGIRVFRVDRIVAADLTEGRFEIPAAFDPHTYVAGGRVFHTDRDREVCVRYSPRVARWIRERAFWTETAVEDGEDGSLVVWHRVADPRWAVSHALQYGAEAEILEPEDVRSLAVEVARELLSAGGA